MHLSRKILAGALITLLPLGSALACTTSAWTGTGAGTPAAASPVANNDASVKRFSGRCGLQAQSATASFVTNNTPDAEATYRARFYFYTGTVSAPGKVFSATATDNGGGAEVIAVRYTPGAPGSIDVLINGASIGTAPALGKRWYGVEVAFKSGTSSGATITTANPTSPLQNSVVSLVGPAPAAATVGSARLGNIDGVASTVAMNFDEFDSTRGDTAIGFLCRGETNTDGLRNSTDGVAVRNEFFGYNGGVNAALNMFQPDCNMDGVVNSTDGVCIRNIFLAGATTRACATGP